MSRRVVVVVGAGFAGTAAALTAARAGAHVTLLDGGTGASTLWTGAVDGVEPSPDARAVADVLGMRLAQCRVVTSAGWVHAARGRDAALLDVAPHGGALDDIAVLACARPRWDGAAVARAIGARVLDVAWLRHTDERALPDADFAARHDDADRLAWAATRLREALARSGSIAAAVLVPPSLGIAGERASELSRLAGVTCGEAAGEPGGPAGLRFEVARDRALATAGVTVLRERADRIARGGARGSEIAWSGGQMAADAVVVATGGFVGGGLAYDPSEAATAAELPAAARPAFRLGIAAPLPLGARGKPLGSPGSLFGVAPEALAWPLARDPLMGRVGVLAQLDGVSVVPGLFVAGEIVADAPRTIVEALVRGARAGAAAAGACSAG